MELSIYQIDAFSTCVFEGNPAAVCPLDEWLPDETMQSIAEENNLSETAFLSLKMMAFIFDGLHRQARWIYVAMQL